MANFTVRCGTTWLEPGRKRNAVHPAATSNAVASPPISARRAKPRAAGFVRLGRAAVSSAATGINGNQNDESGAESGAVYVFTVPPPPCQITLRLTPNVLTPANRRLVEITATLQIPSCVPNPKVKLVSIRSSQADRGLEPGDLPNDIQQASFGTNDRKFLLRAERQRKFSPGTPAVISNRPRVYTVTYDVSDATGKTRRVSATVTVPYGN